MGEWVSEWVSVCGDTDLHVLQVLSLSLKVSHLGSHHLLQLPYLYSTPQHKKLQYNFSSWSNFCMLAMSILKGGEMLQWLDLLHALHELGVVCLCVLLPGSLGLAQLLVG